MYTYQGLWAPGCSHLVVATWKKPWANLQQGNNGSDVPKHILKCRGWNLHVLRREYNHETVSYSQSNTLVMPLQCYSCVPWWHQKVSVQGSCKVLAY